MPEVTAKLKYLRVAPKKVRPLVRVIKGLDLSHAEAELKHVHRQASLPLLKLLRSAVANAENNFRLVRQDLYVKKITVDAGPALKRWMPRAQGRATPIAKRTSHITLVLESRGKVVKEKVAQEPEKRETLIFEAPEKTLEKGEAPKVPPKKEEKPAADLRKPRLPINIRNRFFRRKAM